LCKSILNEGGEGRGKRERKNMGAEQDDVNIPTRTSNERAVEAQMTWSVKTEQEKYNKRIVVLSYTQKAQSRTILPK